MAIPEPAAPLKREASPAVLAAAYLAHFGALAVYGPFLAVYLQKRGYGPEATAQLLSATILVRVVAAPAWTFLADAVRSAGLVLRIVSVCAAASFGLLLSGGGPMRAAIVLFAFAVFRAPASSLVDALVLRWSERTGRAFGSLRVYGTIGYLIGAYATGSLVAHLGSDVIAIGTTILLSLAALIAFALPAKGSVGERAPLLKPLGALLRRPRFLLLLATAMLHQVGLSPYDNLFPKYLTNLAGASFAGPAVAVGAGAELVFLMTCSHLVKRVGAGRVLMLAYAASVVRWGLLAVVINPWALVAIQLFHAFTFGAFLLSAVALVDEDAPSEIRASAQGVFGAFTFGIAAAAALSLAGVLEAHGGLPRVFGIAAGASAVGTALAYVLSRMDVGRA